MLTHADLTSPRTRAKSSLPSRLPYDHASQNNLVINQLTGERHPNSNSHAEMVDMVLQGRELAQNQYLR